jgi:hypothetical protein
MNKSRLLIPIEFRNPSNPQLECYLNLKTIGVELYSRRDIGTDQFLLFVTALDPTAFDPFRQPSGSVVGNFKLYALFYAKGTYAFNSCRLVFECLADDKIASACAQIRAYLLSLRYRSNPHTAMSDMLKIVSKV